MNPGNKIKYHQPLLVILFVLIGAMLTGTILFNDVKYSEPVGECFTVSHDLIMVDTTFEGDLEMVDSAKHGDYVTTRTFKNTAVPLYFHNNSKLMGWIFTFCILVGISFGFILPLGYTIRKLSEELYLPRRAVLKSALLAITFVLMSILITRGASSLGVHFLSFPEVMEELGILLKHPTLIMPTLSILTSTGTLVAVTGVFLCNFAIEGLNGSTPIKAAERFKQLSESLNLFLLALAIIISGTIIASILQREAVRQAIETEYENFIPLDFIYYNGLVFSLILGLIYIPVYLQLRRKGRQLKQNFSLHSLSEEDNGKELPEEQVKHLNSVFNMELGALDTAKIIIAVLSPVLTSLVGQLF